MYRKYQNVAGMRGVYTNVHVYVRHVGKVVAVVRKHSVKEYECQAKNIHMHRENGPNPVVEAVPIRTETVRKRTETVRKRCKHGVHLHQAESVLYPCVRGIFPVMYLSESYFALKLPTCVTCAL